MSALIKIIFYLLFVISLFFTKEPLLYSVPVSLVFLLSLFLPFQKIKQGGISISLFLLFTFLGNMFFHQGKVLYHAGDFILTEEGMTVAVVRTLRLFLMIAGAKILIATTPVGLLVAALGRIFRPFERLGLPVTEFFTTMGLVLQSLPKLKKEMTRIYEKKIQEGKVDGFWNRAKAVSQIFSDFFVRGLESPEKFIDAGSKRTQDG